MHKNTKKKQQGAIGLFGVLTLLMAVLFVAVAVDSGRLWMEKRKLQNIADMAAIAAGGQVGGCAQNNSSEAYKAAAQAAAAANGYQGNLLAAPNAVQLGGYHTDNDGIRTFAANNERSAVRVLATQEVPSSLFAGGIFNQRIVLRTEAVGAVRTPYAMFRVGSTIANVNLLNNLLGSILGADVRLLSYDGLLRTNIHLLDLVNASPNVGSVSELLNANISLGDFFTLLQTTVDRQGSASDPGLGSVVESLGYLATRTVNSLDLRLGDVVKISNPDPNAVASTQVNLLNLITTAAFVANGNNFIDLPLAVSLPGLAEVLTRIRIIEPPQLVIGPPAGGMSSAACTIARTAQVRTETIIKVNVLLASIDLRLSLDVGTGRAELMEIKPSGPGRTQVVVNAYPGLAALRLTNSENEAPAKVNLLLGLIPLAEIGLNVPIAQAAPSTMTFSVEHPAKASLPMELNSYSGLGRSLAGFAQAGSLDIKVLGLDLGGILDPIVRTLVVPLLAVVTGSILDPLLQLLGINIAGVTVILDDVNSGSTQALIR